MTDQELREKIAIRLHTKERSNYKIICEDSPINTAWEDLEEIWREYYRKEASQFIKDIKQADYVRLAGVDIVGFLTKVKNQIELDKRKLEENGFVIDNLDDRWQKLAFTLYTDIASLSTEAEQLLETMAETEKG